MSDYIKYMYREYLEGRTRIKHAMKAPSATADQRTEV